MRCVSRGLSKCRLGPGPGGQGLGGTAEAGSLGEGLTSSLPGGRVTPEAHFIKSSYPSLVFPQLSLRHASHRAGPERDLRPVSGGSLT